MATRDFVRSPGTHRARRLHATAVIVAGLFLAALLASVIWIPVAKSRSVAFYVDKQPVTETHVIAMEADLPFDSTSEYYGSRVELMDPSSAKAQYLAAGLKTEAIQRLIIMHAQAMESANLGLSLTPSGIDAAVQAYVKEHATADDSAEAKRLESPEMRSYIELRAISKMYEDNLTKNATVSPAEEQQYFATWGWRYTDAQGEQLTFEKAHQRIEKDALENKKLRVILDNRAQLLKTASALTNGDTRYKQFMRWWDIMFGIQVPDTFQPLQTGTGS
jgi:hypothetical protein